MSKLVVAKSHEHLGSILEEFLENFLSENTKKAYANDMRQFSDFMNRQFPEIHHPSLVLPKHMIAFREKLRKDFSPSTINRRLSAISSIFRELLDQQVISTNPVQGLKRPPVQTIRPATGFSDEEVEKILGSFDDSKILGLQRKTIFAFLFFTGARVSELLAVKVGDIELRENVPIVVLHGKGEKIRVLPLNDQLMALIRKLVKIRSKEPGDYLFTGTLHRENKKLNRMTIHKLIKTTLERLDLSLDRSCHSSRRTLISNLLENGNQLQDVQKIAGHASPETTVRYNVRSEELAKSPLLKVDFEGKKTK